MVKSTPPRSLPPQGAAASEQRATISIIGPAGSDRGGVDLSTPETIDNSAGSYLARVALADTAETRLAGYRIRFTAPASHPNFDRLAVKSFAF